MRTAQFSRSTNETQITLSINLDGTGIAEVSTGIGFLDHMLCAFAQHGLFDLSVHCVGDLHVDAHHTVEDCGICLGSAVAQALGEKRSITRVGQQFLPMDEALVLCALDISGRPYLSFNVPTQTGTMGAYDACLTQEFMRAFANAAGITLHVRMLQGENAHHIAEATYKALGRVLSQAVAIHPRVQGIPSTKGTLG